MTVLFSPGVQSDKHLLWEKCLQPGEKHLVYLDTLLKLPQLNDSTESSFQWEGFIFPRVGSRLERQSASKGNRKESDASILHVK